MIIFIPGIKASFTRGGRVNPVMIQARNFRASVPAEVGSKDPPKVP